MTAYSELGLRARGAAHDIPNPADVSPALVPTTVLTGQDVAERTVLRRVVQVLMPAETHATTGDNAGVIGERPVLVIPAAQYPNGARIVDIGFTSDTAVLNGGTNYHLDTFKSTNSAGGGSLTTATLTSNSAVTVALGGLTGAVSSTTAHKRYDAFLSATLANRIIPPDGCLTLTRTKAAGGVQLPDHCYDITLEAL
jgi:hypothetical protein